MIRHLSEKSLVQGFVEWHSECKSNKTFDIPLSSDKAPNEAKPNRRIRGRVKSILEEVFLT